MITFYYGAIIPGADANEGIYFIKDDVKGECSIYAKVNGLNPVLYANLNEVTSATIDSLWNRIGENFVAKSFKVAGMDMDTDITVDMMKNALQLKNLAYKNEATGTLTDYVTEVQGVNYTPTGKVEIILGYDKTTITSNGNYTPKGTIIGTSTSKGNIILNKNDNGIAVSGTVSTPEVSIQNTKTSIKQIASTGTLPSYTPAEYTAPSLNSQSASFATQGMIASINSSNPELLEFSWASTQNAIASIDFNKGNYTQAAFNPGTLPTIDNDLSVVAEIQGAKVSQPIFTGDKISASFVGEESEIEAIFTGTEETIIVSGEYDKTNIQSSDFTGVQATITPTLIKENKTITVQ